LTLGGVLHEYLAEDRNEISKNLIDNSIGAAIR